MALDDASILFAEAEHKGTDVILGQTTDDRDGGTKPFPNLRSNGEGSELTVTDNEPAFSRLIAIRNSDIKHQPLPSQWSFYRSNARFKGFSGPIGSGKSQALCYEALRMAYVNGGRTGLIGAPTYQMLRDATQKSLFEVLEQERVPFRFNKSENSMVFPETKSQVIFRSLEEYERLRGTNLAWFGVDELTYVAEEGWSRLQGRLRDPQAKQLQGFGVWTPKGFDWVYRQFIAEPPPGVEVVIAQAYENVHLLSRVPDFYDRLRTSYDEYFFKQEVLGSYVNMSGGLVYKTFLRTRHVRPCAIDPGRQLLWALDFNVDPMASVVVQIAGSVAEVVDEIFMRRATTKDTCEEFLSRYAQHPAGIRIYGDASGKSSHSTGPSDYQMIRDVFRAHCAHPPDQRVPSHNPPVRERISVVNAKLLSAAGDIGLFIDPRCKELIKDFEQLSYKERTTQPDKDKDPERSHASDALGYLLWQEFHKGPAGERQTGRLL